MKKFCFVLIWMTLIVTGCIKTEKVQNSTFQLKNEKYLITVSPTDILVSDAEGRLTYPVRYCFSQNLLAYETLSFTYTPSGTSVLQIGALLQNAFQTNLYEGFYAGTAYKISLDPNGNPTELTFGSYHFDFIR